MRSLEARLSRIEKKRRAAQKKASISTLQEYQEARFRHRIRRADKVRLRMFQIMGREDEFWNELSESDRKLVEDPPEVVARDEDIGERGRRVYSPDDEEDRARRAEEVRQKLLAQFGEKKTLRVAGGGVAHA